MKLEKGGFTASSDDCLVVLNDDTLRPDRIVFWVEGTYPSHGFDDGTQAVAAYSTTSTKNDRSIYVYNTSNSTVLMSGKVNYFDVGEFEVGFDVRNGTQIGFLAIED